MNSTVSKLGVIPKDGQKRVNAYQAREIGSGKVREELQLALDQEAVDLNVTIDKSSLANNPLLDQAPEAGAGQNVDSTRTLTIFDAIAIFATLYKTQMKGTIFQIKMSVSVNKRLMDVQVRIRGYQAQQSVLQKKIADAQPSDFWRIFQEVATITLSVAMGAMFGGPGGAVAALVIGLGLKAMDSVKVDKQGNYKWDGKGDNLWTKMFDGLGIDQPGLRFLIKIVLSTAISAVAAGGAFKLNSAFGSTARFFSAKPMATLINTFLSTASGMKAKYKSSLKGNKEGITVGLWGDLAKSFRPQTGSDTMIKAVETGITIGLTLIFMFGAAKVQGSGVASATKAQNVTVQRIFQGVSIASSGAQVVTGGLNAYISGLAAYYGFQMADLQGQLINQQKDEAAVQAVSQAGNTSLREAMKKQQNTRELWIAAISSFRSAVLQAA